MRSLISKFIVVSVALLVMSAAQAAGNTPLFKMHPNVDNYQSLQRGAKLFMNYCHSCHSAAFSRYNRVADDLGISETAMEENLMFTGRRYGETMVVSLPSEQAKKWFGGPAPDLSVRARARGSDWIYSYLKTFYVDDDAPRGVNNCMLAGTSMPHVLWQLQGLQELTGSCDPHHVEGHGEHGDEETHGESDGHGTTMASPFTQVTEGLMTAEEYDQAVYDVTNFLVYLSEPAKLKRETYGIWVLLFLALFTVVAYYMKKEFWKDIH